MREPIYMQVSNEVLNDVIGVQEALDQRIRPWTAPDPSPFPRMILFPRVERSRLTLVEVRERVAGALDVLRHGAPDCEVDW